MLRGKGKLRLQMESLPSCGNKLKCDGETQSMKKNGELNFIKIKNG